MLTDRSGLWNVNNDAAEGGFFYPPSTIRTSTFTFYLDSVEGSVSCHSRHRRRGPTQTERGRKRGGSMVEAFFNLNASYTD